MHRKLGNMLPQNLAFPLPPVASYTVGWIQPAFSLCLTLFLFLLKPPFPMAFFLHADFMIPNTTFLGG